MGINCNQVNISKQLKIKKERTKFNKKRNKPVLLNLYENTIASLKKIKIVHAVG